MIELSEQLVDIFECGSTDPSQPSVTLASVPQSNEAQSKPKRSFSKKPAPKPPSIVTLDQASTSEGQDTKPYWTELCAEKQSDWWLPHQIGSADQSSISPERSLNHLVEQLSFWKKLIRPTSSTCDTSLPMSLPFVIPKVDAEVVEGVRKIRIYPKGQAARTLLDELLRQQRRAYNLAIACFKEADERPELRNDDLKMLNLRPVIRDFVRDEVAERGGVFFSASLDDIVKTAYVTRDAVISKRKKGEEADYGFKSRKAPVQSFIIQQLSKDFLDKNFKCSEQIPPEAFKKQARFVFQNGRWFISAKKKIATNEVREIQAGSIVAIDPGVRCFATTYSKNEVAKYGDGFFKERVYPLLLKLDRVIGLRDKIKRDTSKADYARHYEKKIHRIRARVSDRIDDLHRRVAKDIVQKHDVVLLPTFETSEMTAKEDRNIRTKTVRAMLGLAHYKFQSTMKWMCKKLGKTLVLCNEAYTSKTRSWNGTVVNNLGGATSIRDENIIVDRDVNGARGILLRAMYGLDRSSYGAADVAFVAV